MSRIIRQFFSLKNKLLKTDICSTITNARNIQMGQKVLVNGVNIHYERVGNGNHNLLLLPGALGSTRTDFTPQLNGGLSREKFTLIAWDPPGYGYSRPPERDFNDFYRKDAVMAAQLMKALGIDKYSLFGWSDGGITALIIAAANQDSVKKLVVFGSNSYVCDEDRELLKKIRDLNKWNPKAKQAFIDVYGEELFTKMWYSFVDNYVQFDDICKEDLKCITQKCLILHGDQDPLVAREHPDYLLNSIKNARLHRFPKGKHNIHQKYAQEFQKLVEPFLLEDD